MNFNKYILVMTRIIGAQPPSGMKEAFVRVLTATITPIGVSGFSQANCSFPFVGRL